MQHRVPPFSRRSVAVALVALIGLIGFACADRAPVEDPGAPTTAAPPAATAPPPGPAPVVDRAMELFEAACDDRVEVSIAGAAPEELSSISGLAASRRHPGVVWAIEDSFEPADLVALDPDGTTRGRIRVAAGALANLDWEDLAVAPSADGTSQVHIADIGDNLGIRREVRILTFDEPALDATGVEADDLRLTYESGRPNAEALAVIDQVVWVIDKTTDGPATIWRGEPDPTDGERGVLRPAGAVDLGGEAVTAIDVSPDATVVALRTLDAVRLYPLGEDGDLVAALAGGDCATPPPPERQGESVAFVDDGAALVTVSEDESGGRVELHRLAQR